MALLALLALLVQSLECLSLCHCGWKSSSVLLAGHFIYPDFSNAERIRRNEGHCRWKRWVLLALLLRKTLQIVRPLLLNQLESCYDQSTSLDPWHLSYVIHFAALVIKSLQLLLNCNHEILFCRSECILFWFQDFSLAANPCELGNLLWYTSMILSDENYFEYFRFLSHPLTYFSGDTEYVCRFPFQSEKSHQRDALNFQMNP